MPVMAARKKKPRNIAKEQAFLTLNERADEMKNRSERGLDILPEADQILTTSNKLIDFTVDPSVVYYDSVMMHTTSVAIYNQVHTITASLNVFDEEVFASNLLASLTSDLHNDGDTLQWRNLEPIAEEAFKYAPSITFLLGSLEDEPRVQKKQSRAHHKRDEVVPYKVPQGLQRQEAQEIDMEERMRKISLTLLEVYKQEKQPVDFFSFVMDPDSYGRTVQNIFHVSHLVREGLFDLIQGANTPPVIKPINPKKQKEAKSSSSRFLWHLALPFGMEDWEALKETLKIEEAMIQPMKINERAST